MKGWKNTWQTNRWIKEWMNERIDEWINELKDE